MTLIAFTAGRIQEKPFRITHGHTLLITFVNIQSEVPRLQSRVLLAALYVCLLFFGITCHFIFILKCHLVRLSLTSLVGPKKKKVKIQ